MKSRLPLGVAAVVVTIIVVLGARFAQRSRMESAAADSGPASGPASADDEARGPTANREWSNDERCAAFQRSTANTSTDDPADVGPIQDPYMTAARQRLLVSQSPENLATVAIMALDDNPQRMDAIHRAMSTGRQNATVVWAAVQMCNRSDPNLNCPAQEWQDQLVKLDSENSEVWIRVATDAYQRGDTAQALDALRRAATAAETRDYWPETVAMAERALESAGGYSFPERVVGAIGVAASNIAPYGPRVRMCRDQASLDAEWAQTCLEYGRLAERQGKTEIGIDVARSVQHAVLEATGDMAGADAVEARQAEANRERLKAATDARGNFFVFTTPRLFAEYLAALQEHGESAALAQARSEAERLVEECSQPPSK